MAREEINLELRVVYGAAAPRKKRDVHRLTEVTLRNLWMEDHFLFEQLRRHKPDAVFHRVDAYVLMYQPPDSPFAQHISLADRKLQEEAIRTIARMKRKHRKKLLFHFIPASETMTLFAESVHKSSLESYRDKAAVLGKLCDMYVSSRLPLKDFDEALDEGYEGWKQTVYNFLPPDEQEYHKYLCRPSQKNVTKSNERKYMDDDIGLRGYEDLKFPERKLRRDREQMEYPQAYAPGLCVICRSPLGLIKCLQCPNLVCKDCIISEFLTKETSCGSFMLVHRRFCMRFGHVPDIPIFVEATPGVLNTLRLTGKGRAEAALLDKYALAEHEADEDAVEEDSDNEVDLVAQKKAEDAKRYAEAIAQMRSMLDKAQSKLKKAMKGVTEYQLVIDDTKRTQQMRDRTRRLLDEEVALYRANVKTRQAAFDEAWAAADPQLAKIDKSLQELYDAVSLQFCKMDRLVVCESFAAYEEAEAALAVVALQKKRREVEDSLKLS
jgi:hypothetical protein